MADNKHKPSPTELFDAAMTAVAKGESLAALKNLRELLDLSVTKEVDPETLAQSHNQAGIIQLGNKNFSSAVTHFEAARQLMPFTPGLELNLGVAQVLGGTTKAGIKTLETLAEKDPGMHQVWFHLGEAHLKVSKFERACEWFEKFLKKEPENADALLELGICKEQLNYPREAEELFEKVKQLQPNFYVGLFKAAEGFYNHLMMAQAKIFLTRAAKVLPEDPIPHHMVGVLYQKMNELELAEEFLKKSIAITPTPESYGQMAALFEKANRLNEAWATANLGLRLFPDDPYMKLTLARVERRAKKFDKALDRLEAITGTTGDTLLESQINFQLGWLYDQGENFDKAFECYKKAKAQAAETADPDASLKKVPFTYINAMKNLDLSALPKVPFKAKEGQAKEVVFLVGFPRSGTTLLNQILDSHPDLVAIEEEPTLPAVFDYLKEIDFTYPGDLTKVDEKKVEKLREIYFERASLFCSLSKDKVLVDKLPLNLIHLPLIWTMFPGAKVILALRNPMGAVLSNFMHNFEVNSAMANMFSLDDITKLYAAVMDLWFYFKDRQEINFHAIKYEDIVTDLEGQAKALCSFLGVGWEAEMLDYSRHARSKGLINTPSYHQVVQPLYKDSLERWRRYGTYMAPFEKRLTPYCQAFGYTNNKD